MLVLLRQDGVVDWAEVNFSSLKPRAMSRDYLWGIKLAGKLSFPLLLVMVRIMALN